MAYSRFRHVLLLDADNFPVRNPERLLRCSGYLNKGAIFWPDFPTLSSDSKMWELIGQKFESGIEQESGQVLFAQLIRT